MMDEKKGPETVSKTVRIRRVYPDDLDTNFISNFVIQNQPDHFIITFYELWPPVIVGSPEEKKAAIEEIDSVDAKCVSRLVLTPEKMRLFLNAVQENLNKYEKRGKQ